MRGESGLGRGGEDEGPDSLGRSYPTKPNEFEGSRTSSDRHWAVMGVPTFRRPDLYWCRYKAITFAVHPYVEGRERRKTRMAGGRGGLFSMCVSVD